MKGFAWSLQLGMTVMAYCAKAVNICLSFQLILGYFDDFAILKILNYN